MGLVAWFKSLWENEGGDLDEGEYICPRCNSTQIGYFSVISNYVQVIRGIESPNYIETAKCNKCGYVTDNLKDLKRK